MTVYSRIVLSLFGLLLVAGSASAQTAAGVPNYAGLGAGIGMGLSVIGVGLGIGVIGFSALAGIARQPEQAKAIGSQMILLAGLVEGAGIVSLILCFLIGARLLG